MAILLVAAAFGAGHFTVVEEGVPTAVVVLSPEATDEEVAAAAELVRYVRKVTGAALAVQHGPNDGRPAILVGASACPAPVRERLKKMKGDGYIVETSQDGSLILAGKGRHGTSFAVYEFLERAAGVRWLWPGELGEIVPRSRMLRAESLSLQREPAFLWRSLGPGGALWGPADRWQKERELGISAEHQKTMRTWERRNRFGGVEIYGGHAFGEILPPAVYGPKHPEYYALVNGERDWKNFNGKHRAQLCTSNSEVVRLVAEYCRRKFDEHPEYYAVSISANDGRGFCECDRCARLDTGDTQPERADPETGEEHSSPVITDRMVTFANQVAALVAETHPGKKVIFFAYSQYREPPKKTRAHPNVIIQYAGNSSGYWNERYREKIFRNLEGWSRAADNLAIYGYHTQGNFPDMYRLIPDLIAMDLRKVHELGFGYYQTQAGNGFAVNGLNFYVLGRLLWDPSADVAAIVDDYVNTGFGAAARPVKRFFNRHIERWKAQKSAPIAMNYSNVEDYRNVMRVYPDEYLAACRKDIEEALALAEGDARERVEFLSDGLRFVEMTMNAARKTFPLIEAGWKPSEGYSSSYDRAQIDAAIRAWEERDRFIEQHKEDFVLSYTWVQYNNQLRSFNPLERFRRRETVGMNARANEPEKAKGGGTPSPPR